MCETTKTHRDPGARGAYVDPIGRRDVVEESTILLETSHQGVDSELAAIGPRTRFPVPLSHGALPEGSERGDQILRTVVKNIICDVKQELVVEVMNCSSGIMENLKLYRDRSPSVVLARGTSENGNPEPLGEGYVADTINADGPLAS